MWPGDHYVMKKPAEAVYSSYFLLDVIMKMSRHSVPLQASV
jgi:hypothetical protein